jgi:hypothetical protein
VGYAIAQVAIVPLEEMLEQPGCPNLYWALTNLPAPFFSLAKGIEGERVMFDADLRGLSSTEPITSAELKKLTAYIDMMRDLEEKPRKEKTQAWLEESAKDAVALAARKGRLMEYGILESRLSKFPAEQIILLDEKREYEVRRDEIMKLMSLPTWEVEERTKDLKLDKVKYASLFGYYIPAMQKVRRAQGRLEQRIALLRHVEAIRLYAAEHKNQLPDKLSDITVPLPVDPFTGKAFRYSLEGATAHLRGTPPPGAEEMPAFNLHYELTLRKP